MRPEKSVFGAMPESMMATPTDEPVIGLVDGLVPATRGNPSVSRSVAEKIGPADVVSLTYAVVFFFLNTELALLSGYLLRETVRGVPRWLPVAFVALFVFTIVTVLLGQTALVILFAYGLQGLWRGYLARLPARTLPTLDHVRQWWKTAPAWDRK